MKDTTKELTDLTEREMSRVVAAIDRLDWRDPAIYSCWLAQTYYFVCHSTRILAAAASRWQTDEDAFHRHSVDHAREERGHEKIALADLQAMGFQLGQFPELVATKALYHSAYYLIERKHPFALYGYVYFLELLSLRRGNEIMNVAKENFGEDTVRFLALHASEDVGHIEGYKKFLLERRLRERGAIAEAIQCTAGHYTRMVQEVKEIGAASAIPQKKAA